MIDELTTPPEPIAIVASQTIATQTATVRVNDIPPAIPAAYISAPPAPREEPVQELVPATIPPFPTVEAETNIAAPLHPTIPQGMPPPPVENPPVSVIPQPVPVPVPKSRSTPSPPAPTPAAAASIHAQQSANIAEHEAESARIARERM